jgi:hypothetical protein
MRRVGLSAPVVLWSAIVVVLVSRLDIFYRRVTPVVFRVAGASCVTFSYTSLFLRISFAMLTTSAQNSLPKLLFYFWLQDLSMLAFRADRLTPAVTTGAGTGTDTVPIVALEVAAADGTGPTRRLIVLLIASAVAVVLVAATVAVLETAVAARLAGPALLLLELPQAAVTETGFADAAAAVVAAGIGSAFRTDPVGHTGIPPPTGVTEWETLIGAASAGALTVDGVQTCTDQDEFVLCEVVGADDLSGRLLLFCRGMRSTTRGAVVAAVGLSVSAVLELEVAHLADSRTAVTAERAGRRPVLLIH